jgi:hypothetical protein
MSYANATNGSVEFNEVRLYTGATDYWNAAKIWLGRIANDYRKNRAAQRSAPIDGRLLSDIGRTPWGNSTEGLAEQNEWRH